MRKWISPRVVLDLARPDDDDRRLLALGVLTEGLEVVPAREELRRLPHGLRVQTILDPPDEPLVEGRAPAGDAVHVRPRDGVVPGVELRRRRLDREHVDVEGKAVVQALEDLAARKFSAPSGARPARGHGRRRPCGRPRRPRHPPRRDRAPRASRPGRSCRHSSASASRGNGCPRTRASTSRSARAESTGTGLPEPLSPGAIGGIASSAVEASMRRAIRGAALLLIRPCRLAQARPTPTPGHHDRKPDEIFRRQELSRGVYVLYGGGGNVGFLVGPDAVLVVDSQVRQLGPGVVQQIQGATDKPIKYLLNTHHHGDHTGGNDAFRQFAVIIAHDNVRKRMREPRRRSSGNGRPSSRRRRRRATPSRSRTSRTPSHGRRRSRSRRSPRR